MREFGYLFLLIPSSEGRGLQLLQACQQNLAPEDRALIAHRYSTRDQSQAFEVLLSEPEFQARLDYGCFILDWQHKGVDFGLGVEVDRWLDGGLNVLAMASSSLIETARRRYRQHTRVVYAPGGKDPASWLERVMQSPNPRVSQLGLGFEDTQTLFGPIEGLRLSADLDKASAQLSGWMRLQSPPELAAA